MKPGLFITFEGIDGAGKSSQLAWAADFLQARGVYLIVTREPGGTILGEKLRELLLGSEGRLDAQAEALLMFAARRQHIVELIRPALARGACVLCDRFTDATFAYQGGGSGLGQPGLAALEQWVQGDLQPDLTVLFDVSAEVGQGRVARVKSPDRFEREDAQFFSRVRQAYLDRLASSRGRMVRIDGTRSMEEVRDELAGMLDRAVAGWKG